MSILIKGMEMPENCHECEFVDILPTCPCNKMADDDFWNDVSLAVEGHKDCPLIGVPEPHGRLGDLDKLEQMFADIDNAPYSGFDGTETFYSAEDAAQIISLAPTVIPADKDGGT